MSDTPSPPSSPTPRSRTALPGFPSVSRMAPVPAPAPASPMEQDQEQDQESEEEREQGEALGQDQQETQVQAPVQTPAQGRQLVRLPDFENFDFGGRAKGKRDELQPTQAELWRRRQGIKKRWNAGFKDFNKKLEKHPCGYYDYDQLIKNKAEGDKKTNIRTRKLRDKQSEFYSDIINSSKDDKDKILLYWRRTILHYPPPEWVDATKVAKGMLSLRPGAVASAANIYRNVNRPLRDFEIKYGTHGKPATPGKPGTPAKPGTVDWPSRFPANTQVPKQADLFALWSYGDARKGLGHFPSKIKAGLRMYGLGWLVVNPSERKIPDCWKDFAEKNGYTKQTDGIAGDDKKDDKKEDSNDPNGPNGSIGFRDSEDEGEDEDEDVDEDGIMMKLDDVKCNKGESLISEDGMKPSRLNSGPRAAKEGEKKAPKKEMGTTSKEEGDGASCSGDDNRDNSDSDGHSNPPRSESRGEKGKGKECAGCKRLERTVMDQQTRLDAFCSELQNLNDDLQMRIQEIELDAQRRHDDLQGQIGEIELEAQRRRRRPDNRLGSHHRNSNRPSSSSFRRKENHIAMNVTSRKRNHQEVEESDDKDESGITTSSTLAVDDADNKGGSDVDEIMKDEDEEEDSEPSSKRPRLE